MSLQRLEVGDPKAKKGRATGEKKSKISKKTAGGKKAKKDGPKRPLSAFMYFSQENRASVKAANPDATFGELGKLLAEKWGNTSDKKVPSLTCVASRLRLVRLLTSRAEVRGHGQEGQGPLREGKGGCRQGLSVLALIFALCSLCNLNALNLGLNSSDGVCKNNATVFDYCPHYVHRKLEHAVVGCYAEEL